MTTLDLIKEAETKAKDIRYAANIEARDYLRETEKSAMQEAETLLAKAREVAQTQLIEAQMQAGQKLEELLAECDAKNKLLIQSSTNNINEAADFIARKVAGE